MNSTHSLQEVKALIQGGYYLITSRAIKDARADFDYTEEEILAAVLSLNLNDLDQTMPSYKKPGQWQDVYKRNVIVDGVLVPAYIKLNILEQRDGSLAVIISFHKA